MGNMFWLERKFHIVLRINFNLQMDSQHNNASSILQQYYPFRTLIWNMFWLERKILIIL